MGPKMNANSQDIKEIVQLATDYSHHVIQKGVTFSLPIIPVYTQEILRVITI